MNVQFDWQVGTDDGQLETLARIGQRKRKRWPWWIWTILASIILVTAAGGYVLVRRRYEQAQRRIEFQIQSVIDLEARAYSQGDTDLFLEQQDVSNKVWYADQAFRMSQDCTPLTGVALAAPDAFTARSSDYRCHPVLPAQLDRINLQGDIAWAEVIEGNPAVRRARFYRQTELGWKHTAPQDQLWGAAIELLYGDLIFRYHRRDEPHIDELVEHIYQAFVDTCTTIPCPLEDEFEINFAIEISLDQAAQVENGILLLASPWVSGLPLDGKWDDAYLDDLAYAMTYEMTSLYLQAMAAQDLNRLQQVIADEYAVWRITKDTTSAPIVGRLIQQDGEAGLLEVLRSPEYQRSLNLLMARWLHLSATEHPISYFETLLNIEREAMLAGRKDTFLFLQDDTSNEWITQQQLLFDAVQSGGLQLSPIEVQTVSIAGNLARVTLENPLVPTDKENPSPQDQTIFFRRYDGDWKRTSALWARSQVPGTASARLATARESVHPISTPPSKQGP